MSTARDLGPRGVDPLFGAGLVDAYKALMSLKRNGRRGRQCGE